jgi:hypothetical protein
MRTLLKNVGMAAAVALTVAATAGAAQAQHWRGDRYHGGYHRGGGYGPGFVGGLALGSSLGYGYNNCRRQVFVDRHGYRRVRRVCY